MGIPILSFEEFLAVYFERIGPTYEDLWEVDRPEIPERQVPRYLNELFSRAGELLAPYSDQQVALGLKALFLDEVYFALHRCGLATWPERRPALLSFYTLFEQVFAPRCSPHLSDLDEPGANPLNGVCYMWWDNYPVKGEHWLRAQDPSGGETHTLENRVLLRVLERLLYLDSDACRESALHGLNHWALYHPRKVEWIIDDFLESHPDLRPELRAYALTARSGQAM